MPKNDEHLQSLIKLILPEEIFEYFQIIHLETIDKEIHVHLDELDIKPEGFEKEKLVSNGFHQASIIQDFPLRDKAMFLHVMRRRWLVKSNKEYISRDWDTVAKGTRFTKGFATFLKGIFGQLPN